MYIPLFVGVLCLSLFCYIILCVHFSFAIILKRKRKLVALLLLSFRCIVTLNVLWLFLKVPCVCLQYMLVVFLDHTHLLFVCLYAKISHWRKHLHAADGFNIQNCQMILFRSRRKVKYICITASGYSIPTLSACTHLDKDDSFCHFQTELYIPK